MAGVLAEGVTNPRPAEGGADGESIERVRERGGITVRHRRQAITAGDYEALAREASPAVAVARVLPSTHPSGRFAPGWVTVIIGAIFVLCVLAFRKGVVGELLAWLERRKARAKAS